MGRRAVGFVVALLFLFFGGGAAWATCPCLHSPCNIQTCPDGSLEHEYIGVTSDHQAASANFGDWVSLGTDKQARLTLGSQWDDDNDSVMDTFSMRMETSGLEPGDEVYVSIDYYEVVNGVYTFVEQDSEEQTVMAIMPDISESQCVAEQNDSGCGDGNLECSHHTCVETRWCFDTCFRLDTTCWHPQGDDNCECFDEGFTCNGTIAEFSLLNYLHCKVRARYSGGWCVVNVGSRGAF